MFTDHGKENSVAHMQRPVIPALDKKAGRLAKCEISLKYLTVDFISSKEQGT